MIDKNVIKVVKTNSEGVQNQPTCFVFNVHHYNNKYIIQKFTLTLDNNTKSTDMSTIYFMSVISAFSLLV